MYMIIFEVAGVADSTLEVTVTAGNTDNALLLALRKADSILAQGMHGINSVYSVSRVQG
jgi:hypothetical protein